MLRLYSHKLFDFMKRGSGILFAILATLFTLNANSQDLQDSTENVPKDWYLKDPTDDHFQGVSAEKTYSTLLNGKPSKTVLVAVIDSGIDIDHEDLKDIIWVNRNEIANNGIDDDKNGYVDDIH